MSNIELSGRFKIEVIKENKQKIVLADWFSNEILDSGLNRLGTGNVFGKIALGSSSTPVNPSIQTSLESFILSTTTSTGSTNGSTSTEPYYSWKRITFRFPVRASAMNISEVGIGWTDSDMFSRALILAGGSESQLVGNLSSTTLTVTSVVSGTVILGATVVGAGIPSNTTIVEFLGGTGGTGTYKLSNSCTTGSSVSILSTIPGVPTTLSIQPTEILDITYEIRVYRSTTPVLSTISIAGSTYYTKTIPASITDSTAIEAFGISTGLIGYNTYTQSISVYNGIIGSITTNPSGSSSTASSMTINSYSNNSYTIDATFNFSVTSGNLSGGIKSILIKPYGNNGSGTSYGYSISSWQVGFYESDYTTPKAIPKTANDTLSLTYSITWARKPTGSF